MAEVDLSEVVKHCGAKRALEVAAAGGHHVMLIGPRGGAKTMLADRFHTLFPDGPETPTWYLSPVKAPEHCSLESLATALQAIPNGILIADGVGGISSENAERLREALLTRSYFQDGQWHRAHFTAILTTRPCPCGQYLEPTELCHCNPSDIKAHLSALEPLADAIDLCANMGRVKSYFDVREVGLTEHSEAVAERIVRCRQTQAERFSGSETVFNGEMTLPEIRQYCRLCEEGERLLKAFRKEVDSPEVAVCAALRVARTIADLNMAADIELVHLAEACAYRRTVHSYGPATWQRIS